MAASAWNPRVIDLTHPLRPGDNVYPGDPRLAYQTHATLPRDGYRLTHVSLGSHCGTHVDAPSHFLASGETVDSLPLGGLIGPAVVIDLPGQPNAELGIDDLSPHQDAFVPGSRVLLRSGWDRHYPQETYWNDFPGLTVAAARWLKERQVALLGFDTPSPSHDTQSVHEVLLGPPHPVLVVESLANLHLLPSQFTLVVLPLKLTGLDGSPVRAVALVES